MKTLNLKINKILALLTAAVLSLCLLSTGIVAEGEISYRLGMVYGTELQSGQAGMIQISLIANDPSKTAEKITLSPVYNYSGITVSETYGYGSGANPTFTFWTMAPIETPTDVYEISFIATYCDAQGAFIGTETFSVPLNVKNSVDENGLAFSSYTADILDIIPGDEISIEFTLHNETGAYLEDVKVSLPGLSEDKFVHAGGFKYELVDIANGETAKVVFDLIACDGISSVRETISALAEYTIAGKQYTAECDVVVACEPKEESYESGIFDLTMIDYKVSSDRIRPEKVFTLTIEVKNSSDKDIEKARVSIDGLDGFKFAVNKGLTYRDFSIDSGETKEIKFELIGCKGISSTREVLPIEISYGSVNTVSYCTLSCKPEENSGEEAEVFAPNIIIKEYDFGGEFVVAGTKFPLTINFENVSGEATIENLKLTIDGGTSIDGGIAFSAANSAKSFFFEKIDPKGENSVMIEMLAKVDAKPNSYPIDITFTYEYTVNGKRYQAPSVRETINIPLQQEDRLVVNEPYYPNYVVTVGEYCYVSTSLVNMGKSAVYNVTASIRGEGIDMQESSYYIGNIESGREEYYDAEFTPNTTGDLNLEIVITYEDANGNEKEQVFPFTITVQEQYVYEDVWVEDPMLGGDTMIEEPTEEKKLLPDWAWYAIGGAGLIIVIVLISVISKKRKRARLGAFDDDEDI